MRIFTALMVAAAVLATAVVSVRMHIRVAELRYRVWGLEEQRVRAEREFRLAQAALDAAKAPRRLMERWAELHAGSTEGANARRTSATPASATNVRPTVRPTVIAADPPAYENLGPADVAPEDPSAGDPNPDPRR